MKFLVSVILLGVTFLFSCKSSKDINSKGEQVTTNDKKETPYDIKKNEAVPNQSIGTPSPNNGTNGARPEPQ